MERKKRRFFVWLFQLITLYQRRQEIPSLDTHVYINNPYWQSRGCLIEYLIFIKYTVTHMLFESKSFPILHRKKKFLLQKMGEGWRPTPSPPLCQSFHSPVFFSLKQFYIFIIKKLFYNEVHTSSEMLSFLNRWYHCWECEFDPDVTIEDLF